MASPHGRSGSGDTAASAEAQTKPATVNGGTQLHRNGSSAGEPIPTALEGRIRRMLEMVESASLCKISDLASELNLSESRLQHLFKQTTGVGLGRVLTERRLQKAALLLRGTRLRIKEIAAAVGYEHTSSFTRAFEQRFAQPPQVYRRAGGAPKC
jgi:two-component system response regulator YesN